jgi:hypothetical protein
MGVLAVIVAAAAAYAFGAVWYMTLADKWMAAAGLTNETINRKDPKPFIISGISVIIVAGMMRHIMAMAALDGFLNGLMTGFGLGIFVVAPWIVTNYAYSMRPRDLTWIDCGYVIGGCTIIGVVLGLF